MTSTARQRFPNFGTTSSSVDNEQSRALHGPTFGQSFGNGGTSWSGGIWGNKTIGSGLKNGANDSGRKTDQPEPSNNTEVVTGSGSLLFSSEMDGWSNRQATPWNSVESTSPVLQSRHNTRTSASPVRQRQGNQHMTTQSDTIGSTAQYFSALGNGTKNQRSQKGLLNPTSSSFIASRPFQDDAVGTFQSHSQDLDDHRSGMSTIFGSNNPSLSTSGGQPFQQGTRLEQYVSTVPRTGSLPPSRGGAERKNYFDEASANDQHSRFGNGNATLPFHSHQQTKSVHNPSYSTQMADRRYDERLNQDPSMELAADLRSFSFSKENDGSLYPVAQRSDRSLMGNTRELGEINYPNGFSRYSPVNIPSVSQGTQYKQSREQFTRRNEHSPNGNDTYRSRHSPYHSSDGTSPSHQLYTPSRGLINHPLSQGQVTLIDKKLKGLQFDQQTPFIPPINQIPFRPQFPSPYDYQSHHPHHPFQMNQLAQYYGMNGIPAYLPPTAPRGLSRDQDVAQNLRSALLEDFRTNSKTNKRYELKDIYDHIVEFSGDQHGSRFIQQKLETANSDEKDQVFKEIHDNSMQLMTDVFGNYVIQKFFEHGNQSQKKILAYQMKGHILSLSLQMYGCRVVQKALEHILTDQQASLVKELEQHVLRCVRDQNGNHVIQKAIERVPAEHIQFIINAFIGQVHSLATHPYGCRVIQRMLEHCEETAKTWVLQELHACSSALIVDQYGNYVTQHVIEHGRPADRAKIVSLIASSLVMFSRHKFASNVVEKSIQFGSDEQRQSMVSALTTPNDSGESPLQSMMKDQYGNYVIQKLLFQLHGSEYDDFVEHIRPQLVLLKRFSFGKQVAAIEKALFTSSSQGRHAHNASPRSASAAPTPPLLTSDAQSPQSSSLPSTNNSTVDGPVGKREIKDGDTTDVGLSSSA